MLARRVAAALLLLGGAAVASAACPPGGSNKEALQTLKQAEWKVPDDAARQALAIALLDCVGAADPVLRDDLAFDAIARWARTDALTPATLQTLRATLLPRLAPSGADSAGFAPPFAALMLAEVARADRLHPYLSEAERAELVRAATSYLAGVRDYRGFDATEGWRHGVAHGADLLLQLALNPAIDRAQIDAILAAIATQVMPAGHFYIYGEGDRLMAPVFYLGRRGTLDAAEWSAWFAVLAQRRSRLVGTSQISLAANHDLGAFLLPLYVSLRESGSAEMQARMLPGVTGALKAVD